MCDCLLCSYALLANHKNKTNAQIAGNTNNCHQFSIFFNANNVINAVSDIKRYAPNAFTTNMALSILSAVNKNAIGNTKIHFQRNPKTMLIIPRRYRNKKIFI